MILGIITPNVFLFFIQAQCTIGFVVVPFWRCLDFPLFYTDVVAVILEEL
jgi:hypothetical protein